MEPSEILLKAAIHLISIDPSLTIEQAEEAISKRTGYPTIGSLYALPSKNKNSDYKRISWDSYFMSLAFLVSMRSPDSQTQHGSVIVDEENRIVSTGYNGFLPEADDENIPNTRPFKYPFILHSETNAILSAKRDLKGCRIYITGLPCNECLKDIVKSGIKNIIVGDTGHVFAEGYLELQSLICSMHSIEIVKFKGNLAFLDGRQING